MVVLTQARTNTLKSDPLRPNPRLIKTYTRQRITTRLSDRVVALYAEGFSTREVAEKADISRTTVLRILKEGGVTMRPRGGHNAH